MKTPYRYSIKDIDGNYYKVSDIGEIQTQTTPYYFYKHIYNWGEIGVRDTRNMRMGGFFRNRTTEVQFVKTLAQVVRYVKYGRGVLHSLTLYVDRLNDDTQDYESYWSSDINLAQTRDERDQIAASLSEGGIHELIKTNEDVEYSFPVTGSDVVSVKVLPQLVRGVSVFTSVTPDDEAPVVPNRSVNIYNMLGYAQLKETVYEVLNSPTYRPVDYFDVMGTNLAMSGGAATSMQFGQPYQEINSDFSSFGIVKVVNTTSKVVDYLMLANVALESVKIKGSINVFIKNTHASSAVDYKVKFYRQPTSGGAVVSVGGGSTNTETINALSQNTFTFVMDETEFAIPANNVLYIVLESLTPSVLQQEYMVQGGMQLIVEFKHRTTEYTTTGFTAYNLLKKLVHKITGDTGINVLSNLLTTPITYADGVDCRPDKILITSSECLQGKTSPVIKISLKNLLTSLQVWFGCGFGIEKGATTNIYDTVRVEAWEYFFKEYISRFPDVLNKIADFTQIDDWYIEPAEDLIFSELKIGYNPAEIDNLNIADDVHTTRVYTTEYNKAANTKEMISPIVASGFPMYEEVFRGVTAKSSQANDTNRVYVIQYNPTAVAGVHTALYSTDISSSAVQTGLTDPTRLLNPGLTPARCAIRNAPYLFSCLPHTDELITTKYNLYYQSTDRNSTYVSRLAYIAPIPEGGDIDVKDQTGFQGKERIFYPEYLYWTAPSKKNYQALWNAKRNGYFNVTTPFNQEDSTELRAFPIESADWTIKNDTFDFKGLLTAGTGIANLKR